MRLLPFRSKLCVSSVLFAVLSMPLSGQNPSYVPVNDVISSESVTCFAQSPDGYLWIGTTHGLNRYNGSRYSYFLYSDGDSIISDSITSLMCDEQGRLWIGTSRGPDMYDIMDGSFHHFHRGHNNPVYAICDMDPFRVAISDASGLSVLDKDSLGPLASLPGNGLPVKHLFWTSEKELWTCQDENPAIVIYDADLKETGEIGLPSHVTVHGMTGSPGGYVWVATDLGVFGFDTRTRTPVDRDHDMVRWTSGKDILSISHTHNNIFFMGVRNEGIFRMTPSSLVPELILPQMNLFDTERFLLYPDKDENLWIKSSRNGFGVLSVANYIENHAVSEVFSSDPILQSGLFHGDVIWVRSAHEIALFDVKSRTTTLITPSDIPVGVSIKYVSFDAVDRMLVLTDDDCFRRYQLYGQKVVSSETRRLEDALFVWEDGEGNYWLQGESTLRVIHKDGSIVSYPNTSTASFWNAVPSEGDGPTYLFSLDKGVFALKGAEYMPIESDILNADCVLLDKKDRVWVGTLNSGVHYFTLDRNEFRHFTTLNGLKENSVLGIVEDNEGGIWLCSSGCISRFNEESETFTHYSSDSRGLILQYDVSCTAKTESGILCFGGVGGITLIDPAAKGAAPESITLDIDAFLINGELQKTGPEALSFPYDRNQVSIYYSGLDLIQGKLLNYACMLEGLEKEWRFMGQDTYVAYSNLKPGKYVFHLRAQRPDGVWGTQSLSLPITIRAPFWKTTEAKLAYLLLALLSAGGLVLLFIKMRLNKEQLALATREKAFFTNISHEILTPLTLIYGPARELVTRSGLSPEDRQLVQMLSNNSERLRQMTEQLLNFNRMGAGKEEKLQVVKTNLPAILRNDLANYALSTRDKGISLEDNLPEEDELWCDVEKVERIVCNLLGNAIKFTPSGGRIRMEYEHAGDSLSICVKDNGIGIPEDKLKKIFDRYERLDSDGGRKGVKGFGVGLHYSLALARIHRGLLTAARNEEGGSAFTLSIPCGKTSFQDDDFLSETALFPDTPVEETAVSETSPKDVTILVIDDNREIREFLRNLFQQDYDVMLAASAEEGIERMGIQMPDLIICDVVMKGMDGFSFTSKVKSNDDYSHIPVILLTAMGDPSYQLKGVQSGADAFVGKPFDPPFIQAVVENILTNRRRLQNIVRDMTPHTIQESEGMGNEEPELSGRDLKFMEKLYAIMDEHLSDGEFNILDMADSMHMSRSSLYAKTRGLTGSSPQGFFATYRLNKALEMLRSGEMNVSEVGYAVGFGSLSAFSRSFKRQFGFSPSSISEE